MDLKSPIMIAGGLYQFYRKNGMNEGDSKERLTSILALDPRTYSVQLISFILEEIENGNSETL